MLLQSIKHQRPATPITRQSNPQWQPLYPEPPLSEMNSMELFGARYCGYNLVNSAVTVLGLGFRNSGWQSVTRRTFYRRPQARDRFHPLIHRYVEAFKNDDVSQGTQTDRESPKIYRRLSCCCADKRKGQSPYRNGTPHVACRCFRDVCPRNPRRHTRHANTICREGRALACKTPSTGTCTCFDI